MTNTIQELQLIKHTAWMNANRPRRGATEEEANRITPYVIGAVVYTVVYEGEAAPAKLGEVLLEYIHQNHSWNNEHHIKIEIV